MTNPSVRPQFGKMYGLTHDVDTGEPLVREPRLIKVGNGCSKGPAIHVFTSGGMWHIITGFDTKKGPIQRHKFQTRAAAEAAFPELLEKAPKCPYPRKLKYFTFSQQTADGSFGPHWDAIEAHGDQPTSIDVLFFDDEPFKGTYGMWVASECRCKGDGINAMRVISMAKTAEEQSLARAAREAGEKYFPIVNGCWAMGCEYAKEILVNGQMKDAPCSPSGFLQFQLCHRLSIGGTAYYHTTSQRSIQNLFSSLNQFRKLSGGHLIGIPFNMQLRAYLSNHHGQASTQYQVVLEFKASTLEDLKEKFMAQISKFYQLAPQMEPAPQHLAIAAAPVLPNEPVESERDEPLVVDETQPAVDSASQQQLSMDPHAWADIDPNPTGEAAEAADGRRSLGV